VHHGRLGPQAPHEGDLLLEAAAPGGEVLAEGLELHAVPADADPQAEPAAGEDVDLRRLLGHEHRLALRQDDHAGHEFERRQRGEEAEDREGLVEGGVQVVDAGPALVDRGVRAEHVVVGEDVPVAEGIDGLGVGPDRARVGGEFRLGEDDADLHRGHGAILPLRALRPLRLCGPCILCSSRRRRPPPSRGSRIGAE